MTVLVAMMLGALAQSGGDQSPEAKPPLVQPANSDTAALEAELRALDPDDALIDAKSVVAKGQALLAQVEGREVAPLLRAKLLRYVAAGLAFSNRDAEALPYLDDAATLLDTEDLRSTPEALLVQDALYMALAARGDLERAILLQREVTSERETRFGKESREYASALYNLSLNLYRSGAVAESVPMTGEALAIVRRLGEEPVGKPDPNVTIYALAYATALQNTGRIPESIEEMRRASDWAQQHMDPAARPRMAAVYTYGALLNYAARFAEAEEVLRSALALQEQALGRESTDVGLTLNGLGYALWQQGKLDEGDTLLVASSELLARNPDPAQPHLAAITLMTASNLASSRGQEEIALERRRRVVEWLERDVPAGHPAFGAGYWGLGQSYLSAGRYADAIAPLRKGAANFAARSRADDPQRVRVEMTLAEALVKGGQQEEGEQIAMAAYSAAKSRVLSDAVAGTGFIRTEAAFAKSLGEFAEIAFLLDRADLGIEALQLIRFGDLDKGSRALAVRYAAADETGAGLVRELQDALDADGRMRQAEASAIAADDADERSRVQAEMAANDERITQLRSALEEVFPGYGEVSRPRPVALADIRAGLGRDEAVLFVQPNLNGLLAAVVTSDGVEWSLAPDTGDGLVAQARAVRAAIEVPGTLESFPFAAGNALHRAIFPEKFEKALDGRRNIAVVASGYAGTIPLAALPAGNLSAPDGPGWLVERFTFTTPLSLRASAKDSVRQRAVFRFAGFGAPTLSGAGGGSLLAALRGSEVTLEDVRELPPLPGSERELEAFRQAIGPIGNRVVTGDAFTEAAVKQAELDQYDLLVFATHGLVSGELSGLREPALVVTPPSDPASGEDGLLTASEIARLRLDADMVILSACNTAAGDTLSSPSYSGLARAFIHAGARGLMLSHWRVRDDVAARLTVETVRRAQLGFSRAEALRQAQLDLIEDSSVAGSAHPAVWAPFVIIEN